MQRSLGQRLLQGGFWVMAGKLVTASANLLITSVLARLMTRGEVGEYGLALSLVTVGASASQLGLHQAVVRLVAESTGTGRPARARGAVRSVYRYALFGILAVVGVIALGGGGWLAREIWDSPVLAASMGAVAVWTALHSLQILTSETFRGLQDLKRATIFGGVISNAVVLGVLVALYAANGTATLARVILITVGATAVSLGAATVLLRRDVARLGPAGRVPPREVLSVSLPLWVTGLTMIALQRSDLWILGAFLPDEEVGVYFVAVTLVTLVSMSLMLVNLVVPPFIAELYASGQRERLQHVLRATATLAGIPALVVLTAFIAFGPAILGAVYSEDYRSGATVLAILSFGRLFNVLTGSCGVTMSMTGHQSILMRITLVTSVLTVGASLAVVGRYGAVGVATAVSGGLAVQNLWLWLSTRRHTGLWTHVGLPRSEDLRTLFR